MSDEGARLRANYALKWAAIRACRARGVTRYDMNGLLGDGISTFKRGFADHDDLLVASVDVPFSRLRYHVWTSGVPLAKRAVRWVAAMRRGRRGVPAPGVPSVEAVSS
jgi:lipid II:glycine glycyltransferase (peptidoglycan interpeptide bridge formation enzyme)